MSRQSHNGNLWPDDVFIQTPGRREAGDDSNDLTRVGTTATSQRALALTRFKKKKNNNHLLGSRGASRKHRRMHPCCPQFGLPASRQAQTLQACLRYQYSLQNTGGEAEPSDKDGKHVISCPRGHTLPARHNARNTGRRDDIDVPVDHPAIDPENGAGMDVRLNKHGLHRL